MFFILTHTLSKQHLAAPATAHTDLLEVVLHHIAFVEDQTDIDPIFTHLETYLGLGPIIFEPKKSDYRKGHHVFPVQVNQIHLGSLLVPLHKQSQRLLTSDDIGTITTVCHVVANSMQRLQAQEQAHTYTENLEFLVEQKTQQLQDLQSYQTNMIQAMAHEVQTPLTIIRGHIETNPSLQFPALIPAVERIVRCMNSAVFFSQIDSISHIRREHISLHDTLTNLTHSYQYLFETNSIQFSSNITVDDDIYADTALLDLALSNLLSNAIKYIGADEKAIAITLAEDQSHHFLSILDTGIGISEELLTHIYDPFYQGAQSQSGFGLGMSLVKKIMEYHDGSVSIDSVVDHGTTVTLQFPKKQKKAI